MMYYIVKLLKLGICLSQTSQVNSEFAASEDVCLKLRELLDPRERCGAIQTLTTKVFIKVIRVLHNNAEVGWCALFEAIVDR